MCNKKIGSFNLTFDVLIESVLILGITIFFIGYVDNINNNTLFERAFLSKDLSLITNALQSAPGEVIVSYEPKYSSSVLSWNRNVDLSNYNFFYNNNFLRIEL